MTGLFVVLNLLFTNFKGENIPDTILIYQYIDYSF